MKKKNKDIKKGNEQEIQSQSCSHEWENYLMTDDIAWFRCPKCNDDGFVSASMLINCFNKNNYYFLPSNIQLLEKSNHYKQ